MIAASLLALLASSPLELGGSVGIGRLLGEAAVAEGRDPALVDPLRVLWTGSAWIGYQWSRGNLLALRFDQSQGAADLGEAPDLGEDPEETLVLRVIGLEYVAIRPRGRVRLRIGGGLGYATVVDRLETRSASIEARGDGMAAWVRSGIDVPLGRSFRWHLEGVGQWSSFSVMKVQGMESYESDFPVVRLETGLSLSL